MPLVPYKTCTSGCIILEEIKLKCHDEKYFRLALYVADTWRKTHELKRQAGCIKRQWPRHLVKDQNLETSSHVEPTKI